MAAPVSVSTWTDPLPTTPATIALHWNKKMFRDAGLDPNRPPRSIAELDELCIVLLSRGPVASDLRMITVAMKITHDLERVGDEATTIARRAVDLNQEPQLKPYVDLPRMAAMSLEMLNDALEACVSRDPARARAVLPRDKDVDQVATLVSAVKGLGLETCVTLGMLKQGQADRLKEAGLDYYNHNLDTSPEHYGQVISTRTYQDRLDTIEHARAAGLEICSGGIIGMGEDRPARYRLLRELANLNPHPESVPINMLVPVEGTPLGARGQEDPLELVRMIATARILMPTSRVRLSAGRLQLSDEAQALCFLAGANSVFLGDKLLTTANPGEERDRQLLDKLGMSLCA